MKTHLTKGIVQLALAGAIALFYGGVQADGRLDARFRSVEKLLTQSSAAQQIETSGNPAAVAGQDAAMNHLEKAKTARGNGDLETAEAELSSATRTMMEAVSLAGHDERVHDKKVRDFESREESIIALLEAHDRVTAEKGNEAESDELRSLVQSNLSRSHQMLEAGDLDGARDLLDETYVATKVAVEQMRDGTTLVRSLNFESKEEEYAYELDRNDTHLMLVRVLLEEKLKDERISQRVDPLLDEATELRKKAEREAGKGQFEAAVTTLEESTKQVARAIRMAGIFIPG
jgi:hypothetical protein